MWAVGAANGFLVLAHSLSLLNSTQGYPLRRPKGLTSGAVQPDLLLGYKCLHGLVIEPGCTPQGFGRMVSQHKACILASDQIDADGQFIENQLKQFLLGLCFLSCLVFAQFHLHPLSNIPINSQRCPSLARLIVQPYLATFHYYLSAI